MTQAHIVDTAARFPSSYYAQPIAGAAVARYCASIRSGLERGDIEAVFANTTIEGGYFALGLERFFDPPPVGEVMRVAIEQALALLEDAARAVLSPGTVPAESVSLLASVTTSVQAAPTLDARLMNRLPFAPAVRRLPIVGLGCMAGAASLARVAEFLVGHPGAAALLIAVELCTMYWQGPLQEHLRKMSERARSEPRAYSELMEQLVTAAIFRDGAAAVLLVGPQHPLARPGTPRVLASRSCLVPDSEWVMGLDMTADGPRNILSSKVPEFARRGLREAVSGLLSEQGLGPQDIAHWIVHPGGPKVIDAVQDELQLPEAALALSRQALARVGNLSSVTVLYMLDRLRRDTPPAAGTYGLLVAMGPGFSVEALLLQF